MKISLHTAFSRRFGLNGPLILAPMAGGPTTPELVAASCNAGALGFLGGAYLSPAKLESELHRVKQLTDRPFGVNLFTPQNDTVPNPEVVKSALDPTARYREKLEVATNSLQPPFADDFDGQFDVVLRLRANVFSFTFGLLDRSYIDRCRVAGIYSIGGATTLEEALALQESGVDAVVAQGVEAGGHRFLFSPDEPDVGMSTLALTRLLVSRLKIPVIASGGIMDGAGIAAVVALGAQAAQLGTAFLLCPEAGTSEAYRRMLSLRPARPTRLSRAFSGRLARTIENQFAREMAEAPTLPFPIQNSLTRDLRKKAAQLGNPEFLSLWAGQAFPLIRSLPAAELVRALLTEMAETAELLGGNTEENKSARFTLPPGFKPTRIDGVRSPYEQIGGLVHFGRMLDKIRVNRAGRLPAAWVEALGHPNGFDGACCAFLRIRYADLVERVCDSSKSSDDEAILQWAFENGRRPTSEEIGFWSQALMRRGWCDRYVERVRFRLQEVGLPENAVETMFDFIDLDEGRPPGSVTKS